MHPSEQNFVIINFKHKKKNNMKSNRTSAVIFGSFFILAFAVYGTGSAIMETITHLPESIQAMQEAKYKIIISSVLMAVMHTIFNMGIVVIMIPILKPYSKTLTYGYLSAALMCTIMLVVGSVFLLLLVPLSEEHLRNGATGLSNYQVLFILLKKANFYSYQVGMVIWGLGGLMFTALLYKSKIVPSFISIWGFLGYIVFALGAVAELFGYQIGLICDIPGGLFEIFISIWFITKGFYTSRTVNHEYFPKLSQL
jgi:hypothetical protein